MANKDLLVQLDLRAELVHWEHLESEAVRVLMESQVAQGFLVRLVQWDPLVKEENLALLDRSEKQENRSALRAL